MSLLEKLGLARKGKDLTPILGESKSKKKSFSLNKSYVIKGLIFVIFLAFIIAVFPRSSFKEATYKVGEPWRQEDLTAPFTFSLMKSKDELKKEQDQIEKLTPPIYHIDHKSEIQIQSKLDSLFNNMMPVLQQYVTWQNNSSVMTQSLNDSLKFVQMKNNSGLPFSSSEWLALEKNFLQFTRSSSASFMGTTIRRNINQVLKSLMDEGIIDQDKSTISYNEITVRDLKNRTERNYYLANIRDMKEASEYAQFRFSRDLTPTEASIANDLFKVVIQPNVIYNKKETEDRIQNALSTISPTKGVVPKGQVIIRKGDPITKEKLNMIQSLAKAKSETASKLEIWQQYLGEVLTIIAIILVFFMYIYLYRKPIFDNNARFLMVYLALSLVIGATAFVSQLENVSAYVVPIAITPIILTIIFDSRVGLLTTLSLSLLTGMMIGYDFEFVVATITACSMAVYSVRDIKNRSQFFFFTPALVFLTYAVVLAGFTFSKLGDFSTFLSQLISVFINSILIWLTYPLILLFEKVFKVTTDVTLLELSDTNRPLLKALMMRAPGTFHHSLQVANLAEAAAAEIGANSILCRVGALYHDIGKMEKPEYFVENQSGVNEHDKLKPRMSAIVIKAHVSNGIKLAHDEQLPELVSHFIPTHHGTSLIKFFYEKAKEQSENVVEIQEEDFCYGGPLPDSKETGIVMLADGVEASARAMTEPNYQKLENLVNRIIDERLYEGQLNNCPLTFKDLQKIKDIFLNILVGMYHGRVKYPGQDEKDASAEKQPPASIKKAGNEENNRDKETLKSK